MALEGAVHEPGAEAGPQRLPRGGDISARGALKHEEWTDSETWFLGRHISTLPFTNGCLFSCSSFQGGLHRSLEIAFNIITKAPIRPPT